MTALLTPLLLAVALVTTALGGPRLLRAAAPALMRAPRAAVGLLLGAAALWLMALAALSFMLAWLVNGPAILPASIVGVCHRCLTAAMPFDTGVIDTLIPAALLFVLPTAALLALIGLGVVRGLRRRRMSRAIARDVADRSQHATIYRYTVLLIRDPHPTAYSLPQRHGGIVISDALVAALLPDELAAVLAHEREHVRGRHHLVLALLDVVVAPLRWLPLMSAIVGAVPHYLEIAADDAARRCTGTTALASALVKLGDPPNIASAALGGAVVGTLLHAAGPDRIGHLVAPPRIGYALVPLSVLSAVATVFALVTVAVHGPYISAILAGCHLPL
jgi:Zn-dependent protease with chaperone function